MVMNGITSFKNQFLIAMPNLGDPNFFRTVTFICQHNEEGALGIIINRPAAMKLGEIFQQMDIIPENKAANDITVYTGGPVQLERGFVIHSPLGNWDSTLTISDDVSLTTSKDILEAIALGEGPEKVLIALGYAGWGEGQMEKEIAQNAWLNTPSDNAILFDLPVNQRWNAAADQIGVNIATLTAPAGHG